ncbi:MAG TPA: hypothetical protein VGS19_24595, partial [Streptosporangiaceae bacterium]|nr:hypothetical protein [Streptosporangiaceae bacterium]
MTDLLIIRLHPGQQVDPNEFRKWLHGLEISAYDLTFTDNAAVVQLGASQGVLLGKTSGLAQVPPDGSNKIGVHPNTHPVPVMQHYIDYTAGLVTKHALQSAATVAIKAVPPAGHPEYPKPTSYDLRLVITRNGVAITDDELDFNVAVASRAPLPDDQTWYFQQAAATYVTLPPVSSGKLALDLSPNGPPPAFGALVTAIDKVLADDPGGGAKLATHAPLTLGQCQQIASEIIWDRSYYPPPAQPTGDGSADNGYGSLYTNPNPNGPDPSKTDPTRQKFEGQWASYNATTDALAIRLAGYVYAASAAVQCELSSTKATTAAFPFPLVTGQGTPVDTEVELETIPAGASFAVPAAYFYALATQLSPQITADQRYKLATLAPEDNTLKQMTDAATAGTVTAGVTIEGVAQAPEGFLTDSTLTAINISQAARRLAALGTVSGSLPAVTADAHVTELVKAWLGYKDETAKIDTGFWQGEVGAAATAAHQADYLVLVLQVVTGEAAGSAEFTAFLAAIQAAPLSVTNVAELAGLTDQQWQTFFVADPALLPAFTPKGSTLERTAAFIGHLQQFFTTPIGSVTPVLQSPNEPYSLGPPPGDVLTLFAQNYSAEGGGTFKFGTAWDQTALGAAVNDTFPHDHQGQAWLHDALTTIEALYDLTAFAASDAKTSELRFSLIEALYARGFTSAAQVAALTASDFTAALAGSVAYPYATQIQTAAGGPAAPPGSAGSDFKPVNPDRSLTNCVPPEHLSPLGPVAYLSELLSASAASTCEEPKDTDTSQQIGTLLTSRRGPLGDLLATRANLQTPLPAIDLVNESLEALAAAVAAGGTPAGGAVFDTSATSLADLRLRAHGEDEEHECGCGTQPGGLDPAEAFAAIAEHSSPAARHCPPAETAAYAALRTDFTAPRLPYDQPLDVCRSYLCQLETSRFEAMRRFRKDITEFVLDPAPADEPAGFARHLWRYPVRFDLALEYLGISTEEYSLLYSQPLAAQAGEGQLTLWQAYGFPAAQAGEASWTTVVTGLPEFLRRTGLSYCELAELQRSGFVQFTVQATAARQPPGTDTATTATPGAQDTPPADVAPGRLPECEPCCLADWTITFPGATTDTAGAAQTRDPQTPLYELLVFIRLWRRLRERAWCDLTFTELAAVAKALGLFGGTPSSPVVNPDFLRQFAALLILRDDLRVSPLLLLPLWAAPSPADQRKAVALLLAGVERHARAWYRCPAREPEFVKVATSNLDPLSVLAGFDPDTASDTWQALPTHTLRFAEVLGKVYASNFTVGEVLFLFTALPHLDGD